MKLERKSGFYCAFISVHSAVHIAYLHKDRLGPSHKKSGRRIVEATQRVLINEHGVLSQYPDQFLTAALIKRGHRDYGFVIFGSHAPEQSIQENDVPDYASLRT